MRKRQYALMGASAGGRQSESGGDSEHDTRHIIQDTFTKQHAGNMEPTAGQLSSLSMGICIVLQCFAAATHCTRPS